MGKPSIFSGDYHRIMKRRKRVFKLSIVLVVVCVLFLVYSKSAIPSLKKLVQSIKLPDKIELNAGSGNKNDSKKQETKEKGDANETSSSNVQQSVKKDNTASAGEFQYKFPNGDTIAITYNKGGDKIKMTGIKPSSSGIFFDIREDGGAIVFDNPRISDIWIYNSDGSSHKISPDSYKQAGEGGELFAKEKVMEQYENNYVWAARPKFLKDGRILYQSHLPWFKESNNYYLWVCNSDGSNNRLLMGTDSIKPAEYNGFTSEGMPVVTMNDTKYIINVDQRSKQVAN